MVEMLMSISILALIVTGILSFNLWGLSMATRSQIWLAAGDDARNCMRMMHQDIRTAKYIYVGSGSNQASFVVAGPTNLQVGNSLELKPSTNSASWTVYYYDSPSSTLFRTNWDGNSVGSMDIVSANPITNDNYIFTLEDYLGNILSNYSTTSAEVTVFPVVSIYLSFTDLQNPQVVIAPGSPVDFYQIVTKVTQRQRP